MVRSQGFTDHQDMELSVLEELESFGNNLIMTEKDAVKCAGFAKDNWWYLPVSARFAPEDEQAIIDKIVKVGKEYGSPST